MSAYLLYGQCVDLVERLGVDLVSSAELPNLQYMVLEAIHLDDFQPGELLYTSRFREERFGNLPAIQIWRSDGWLRVRIPACGVYVLEPKIIRYYPFSHASREAQRICLLGTILSLWLEWRGILALHASAVVVDGHAVGFLSHSQSGKSTLAAAFVKADFPYLSDDILAISLEKGQAKGHFSYPWMKLWPREAEHFQVGQEGQILTYPASGKWLVRVGPGGLGSICTESRPVGCLYLPERRDPREQGDRIDFLPASPGEAMIELIRYSFSGPLLRSIGVESERLEKLAELVRQAPVRRMIYPAGLEHLPWVREALLHDFQRQAPRLAV